MLKIRKRRKRKQVKVLALRLFVIYCPKLRQLLECQRCGEYRPLDRFKKSRSIRGKRLTSECKDCLNRRVCPNPLSREERNRRVAAGLMNYYNRGNRPTDTTSGMSFRRQLPEKKDLHPDYPVWE